MQGWESDRWLELVTGFENEFGRLPTWADLMMLQEAESSVVLSRAENAD